MPAPLTGPIATQWQFHPCTQLGGDSFGYHWLDPDHFAIYLLDVCGHGVGAALLSVSVLNVLRSQSLPGVDFSQPAQVLAGLNRAFSMEQNNNMFFTLWFGVFCRSSRDLNYASGGHPPALLFHPANADPKKAFKSLSTNGPAVGVDPDSRYVQQAARVAPNCSLVLYSDGVYEIQQANGRTGSLDEFIHDLSAKPFSTLQSPQHCFQLAMERHGFTPLEDDYSLLQIQID
jgi:sigma-B regulation protein RsbU (phosphoserine phosphatase)